MDAFTYQLKTPMITGGRSHIPLADTDLMSVGINYYSVGRKNKLHAHFGEDHTFVVLDGEATFYNKDHQPNTIKKGQAIMLPAGVYYYFENSGEIPLALLRVSALKALEGDESWTPKIVELMEAVDTHIPEPTRDTTVDARRPPRRRPKWMSKKP